MTRKQGFTKLSGLSLLSVAISVWAMSPALALAEEVKEAKDGVKIGTVDMQKVLQTVNSGKMAKSKLEKEFNEKKKKLQAEEAAIKKMSEEFKKQSLVMNDEARMKKQGELQERIIKFQELTARSQGEIQQQERDLTQPIIKKIRTIISDMAKKKGYTVVLEKNENTVLYSHDKDDLTTDVVSAYDKQEKAERTDKVEKKTS